MSKQWLAFFFVTIGTFMVNVDSSIVNVALPSLEESFHVGSDKVQWVIIAYLLIITGILPTIGKLSDQLGRKKFYIIGVIIFVIGSLLSGLSFTLIQLILARAVQAVGGAMIMGNVMAIVADLFEKGNRGKALGIIGSIVAAGTIAGPSIGGLLIEHYGWRSIFFVNVPLSLISIIGSALFLPASKPKDEKEKIDWLGSVLFFTAMSALLFLISNAEAIQISSIMGISLIIFTILAWFFFIRTELRVKSPIINLSFFRIPMFAIGNIGVFFAYFLMSIPSVLLPLFFYHVLHLPLYQIGGFMAAQAIAMIIISPISGWLTDRIGATIPSLTGMAMMTLGLFLMSMFNTDTTSFQIITVLSIFGLGLGLFSSPNNVSVLESLPRSQAGIAGSLIATMRNFGRVAGVAVGMLIFHVNLNDSATNYKEAITFTFFISSMIGLATFFLLSLQLKYKTPVKSANESL